MWALVLPLQNFTGIIVLFFDTHTGSGYFASCSPCRSCRGFWPLQLCDLTELIATRVRWQYSSCLSNSYLAYCGAVICRRNCQWNGHLQRLIISIYFYFNIFWLVDTVCTYSSYFNSMRKRRQPFPMHRDLQISLPLHWNARHGFTTKVIWSASVWRDMSLLVIRLVYLFAFFFLFCTLGVLHALYNQLQLVVRSVYMH